MTRLMVRLAFTLAVVAIATIARAEGQPQVAAKRQGAQATITLRADALSVVQTLTRDRVVVRLIAGADLIEVSGDLNGRVTVQRAGQRHVFSVRTATAADAAAVSELLNASPAVQQFDRLMQSSWAQSARTATPFRSAHALLAVFRGDRQPILSLATTPATPASSITFVRRRGPDACWSAYSRDVVQYTYDLEACVEEARHSWWLGHLAWCAYEYNIKTGLAMVWLLDCYGVPLL
jgi:hypothetical protein